MKTDFMDDLNRAVAYHGHLCSGQVLGVRMARMAGDYFGIEDFSKYKDLIVFVESDRCLADSIGITTHCSIGKRKLKYKDFGKTAASFYDLQTKKGIRLHREKHIYPSDGEDLVEFFNKIPDNELFILEEIDIELSPYDLPGKPLKVVRCCKCNEEVLDGKELLIDGKIYCKQCGGMSYYKTL